MARSFAFFTLFHLSLTFFRPEVPFKFWCDCGVRVIFSLVRNDIKAMTFE